MKSYNWIYTLLILLQLSNIAYAQKYLTAKDAMKLTETALNEQIKLQSPKAEIAWKQKELTYGPYKMRFDYKIFGDKPADGRSLYISMHGGGDTRPDVNDSQWHNQLGLYSPKEGVYIVPRAPTDTWNMWHRGHIDTLFAELVKDAVIMEGVNLNKVYLMGYSAGGDGAYQLAPRMADFWAAAAMMAGHPGDAQMASLRNLPFTLFAGGEDAAYDRNKLTAEYGEQLDVLAATDPGAYIHETTVFPGMPHWMGHKDTVAVPWMAKYTRNPLPNTVVWVQDDMLRERFYWLGMPVDKAQKGAEVQASISGNTISIEQNDNQILYIYLNDSLLNLDKNVIVLSKGKQIFNGRVARSTTVIKETAVRMDKELIFNAKITVENGKVTPH